MFVRFPFDDECARMLGDIVVVLFNTRRVLRRRKRNPRRGRVRVPPARVRSHHVLHCVYVSSFAGKLRVQVMENVLNSSPKSLLTFRESRLFKSNLGGKIFGRTKRRVCLCVVSLSAQLRRVLKIRKSTRGENLVSLSLSLSLILSFSLLVYGKSSVFFVRWSWAPIFEQVV